MRRISDFAQKITKKSKPSASSGTSYGTFPKASKDVKPIKKSKDVDRLAEEIEFEFDAAPVVEKVSLSFF